MMTCQSIASDLRDIKPKEHSSVLLQFHQQHIGQDAILFRCVSTYYCGHTAMMKRNTQLVFVGILLSVSTVILDAFQAGSPNKLPLIQGTSTSLSVEKATSEVSRRSLVESMVLSAVVPLVLPSSASARLEAVNRPDLLPIEKGLNVIQTEKFLTPGQARRMNDLLSKLEKDTGFRVRVLCQQYPNTPGLAIRDYWSLGKEVRLW